MKEMELYCEVKILPKHVLRAAQKGIEKEHRNLSFKFRKRRTKEGFRKLAMIGDAQAYCDAGKWASRQVPFANHQCLAEGIKAKHPLSVPYVAVDTGEVRRRRIPSEKRVDRSPVPAARKGRPVDMREAMRDIQKVWLREEIRNHMREAALIRDSWGS